MHTNNFKGLEFTLVWIMNQLVWFSLLKINFFLKKLFQKILIGPHTHRHLTSTKSNMPTQASSAFFPGKKAKLKIKCVFGFKLQIANWITVFLNLDATPITNRLTNKKAAKIALPVGTITTKARRQNWTSSFLLFC